MNEVLTVDMTEHAVPVNEGGQQGFMEDWEHFCVAMEGGWMSGKTWAGAHKLLTLHIFNAMDDYNRPTLVPSAIIAPTYPNARDFDIPAMEDALDDFGISYIIKGRPEDFILPDFGTKKKPSHIKVRTADEPQRIAGWQAGAGWGDEPSRWKENRLVPKNDPYTQFLARIRHQDARFLQVMFTFTPEGDATRVHEEFSSGKDSHAIYRTPTLENPLAQDFHERQIDLLTEDLAKQYLDGEALTLGAGKIYTSFDLDANTDDSLELDPSLDLHFTVDFNIAPGMHGLICQFDAAEDQLMVIHEIFEPRLDVVGMVKIFGKIIKETGGWRWPVLHVFGDATGETQHWAGTGQSCYEILMQGLQDMEVPFKLRVPTSNPAVVDRVNAFNVAMQDIRGRVHWKCHPRCKRLITDLRELKRNELGDLDKREKKLSHASDAEGYRIEYLRPARIQRRVIGGRISVSARGR